MRRVAVAIGVGILAATIGAVAVVVFAAYCATLVAVHKFSLLLCWLGFHHVGCWVREAITIPAIAEIGRFGANLRKRGRDLHDRL